MQDRKIQKWFKLKNFLLLSFALFVCFAFSKSLVKQIEPFVQPGEVLTVTPKNQHLGNLLQYGKKEFVFTLTNTGDKSLHILKVEHSCGCTDAVADKDILTPKESTRISGRLNSENRIGEFGSQILISYQMNSDGIQENKKITALVGAKAVRLIDIPNSVELEPTIVGREPQAGQVPKCKASGYTAGQSEVVTGDKGSLKGGRKCASCYAVLDDGLNKVWYSFCGGSP